MARKLVVCSMIFISLFMGFMILENREERMNREPEVLRIQQSGVDEAGTANTTLPFQAREYVRILPR